MKVFLTLATLLITTISFGQIKVDVSGNIFNSGQDSVYLAQFYGTHYVKHFGAKLSKEGNFELKGELPYPDYYVLKVGDDHVNLILRNNSTIKVYGDGKQLNKFANILGSDESSKMNEYLQAVIKWQEKSDSAVQVIQKDPTKQEAINKEMSNEYYKFQGIQKSFISSNPNSAALFPVATSIDPNADFATYESLVKQLDKAFADSPSIQNLKAQYVAFKAERFANDPLAPGKPAPDFEEKMTDGVTSMKLSDLKGQVVLLDFWASWCGPCRRENPNVVALYNKYKDDGFTVMSVSLDKSKEAWMAAIEKDGLTWPNHVSDLKYWSSAAAKMYGVTGIPFTVLIDKEGNIIGTKLRGEELQQELARIFGH